MSYVYEYPMPAIAADIAVLVINEREFLILLIKRKNEPFKDYWALPGGFMDINEKIFETAQRELMEETGIKTDELDFFNFYDDVNRDPRGRVVSFVFIANFEQCPKISPSDDAIEAKWFNIFKLPENIAFDHKKIINDILETTLQYTQMFNED